MLITNFFFYLYIFIIIIFIAAGSFYKKISKKLNLYDFPNSERKIHNKPVSLINGFIILLTLNLYFFFDIFFFKEFNLKFEIIIIILLNFFYLLGYYDDLKDITAKNKTFIIITSLVIIIPFDQNLVLKSLIFKEFTNNEIHLNQLSIFVTVFFIYIFYNFMNFIDGLNGVAISVAIFFIIILALNRGEFSSLEILLVLCLLYCLILNLKNKSFLGNSGISVLSIFISVFYIRDYNLMGSLLCDEIFIIFFIPGIDMTRLVFSRIFSKKSISQADKNHLHHFFLNYFDKRYIFIYYLIVTIIPYLIFISTSNFIVSAITSLVLYSLLILFLKKQSKKT